MVQVWILPRTMNPLQAIKVGLDSIVCFECKHRPANDGSCYVLVHNAPNGIHKKYLDGGYPYLSIDEYERVFLGRKTRFGAYGETVLIPLEIMRTLVAICGCLGYTHQWKRPEFQAYKHYVMASVDSQAEYWDAKALGWRTFRVRTENQALTSREISCPASDEAGKKSQCIKCGLCNGVTTNDARKDIAIIVHGSRAPKFIQIGA
jgi:hypothetical protein